MSDTESLLREYEKAITTRQKESTVVRYIYAVEHWLQWLENNDIAPLDAQKIDIEDYISDLISEEYPHKTIVVHYSGVKSFYERIPDRIERGRIDGNLSSNPAAEVEITDWDVINPRKSKRARELHEDVVYVKPEEIQAMCDNVPVPQLRNELIIKLLWYTGLRRSELANIRLEDLDTEERVIKIYSEKTDTSQPAYYGPELNILLDRWINGGYRDAEPPAADSPYLFPTRQSERISPKHVSRVVHQAADNADIQETVYTDKNGHDRHRITPHTIRHGMAMNCLKNGMDISFIQRLLRHERLKTTRIYLEADDSDVRKEYRNRGPDAISGSESESNDG